ncbi:hypothetical protein AB0A74_09635 [Saccharothrix sp. NPDC042600]|uniref:hypothetical protein n=1 Tax=Saccharothrix TaxID=2071 RepID=UPI0033E11703
MDTARCLSNGWSVITSAPTNSQLAGVLAGFVFTGIIILFGRQGPANTRTLALLCAAFVVLGFDSYLFSLIAGGSFDSLCQRIWAETMAASGLLGVGGMALISGIAWLLANHAWGDASPTAVSKHANAAHGMNLGRLSRFMVFGVAAGVTLLLGMTTLDYIYIVIARRVPTLLVVLIYALPIVVVVLAALLAGNRAARARRDVAGGGALPARSLSTAIFCTLSYGIVGPLFAGAVTNIGDAAFSEVWWILVGLSLTIGFVVPVGLIVLLVYAVPYIEPSKRKVRTTEPPTVPAAEPDSNQDGKHGEPNRQAE